MLAKLDVSFTVRATAGLSCADHATAGLCVRLIPAPWSLFQLELLDWAFCCSSVRKLNLKLFKLLFVCEKLCSMSPSLGWLRFHVCLQAARDFVCFQ